MPTLPNFDDALAALTQLNRNKPRILSTEVTSQPLPSASPASPQPQPEGGLRSIYQRFQFVQEALAAGAPVLDAENRVVVSSGPNDPWGGDLQAAIDYVETQQPGPNNRFIIELRSTEYEGNFVVSSEYIWIVSLSGSPGQSCILRSTSGTTLTMPSERSGIQGLVVISESNNPADAAFRLTPVAAPGGNILISVLSNIITTTGARGVVCEVGASGIATVYTGISAPGAPFGLEMLSGFFFAFTTSLQTDAQTALYLGPGTQAFLQLTPITALAGAGGWVVDADGAGFGALSGVRVLDGDNGVRLQNGSFGFLQDMLAVGGIGGTGLEIDATSFVQIGNFNLVPGGDFYSQVNNAGTISWPADPLFSSGVTADRPADPKPGMRYYATDRAPGTQQLLYVPGTGWVDQADTVVP